MMKMRITAILMGLLSSLNVLGAGSVTAYVTQVRVDAGGQGMVTFSQPIGGSPPSCVLPYYANSYAFDTNTVGGRAFYAMLLSAKATGSQVSAYGTGSCTIYVGVVENLNSAYLQ